MQTINLNKLRLIKQVLTAKPVADNRQKFDCPVCGARNIIMHPLPISYFANWQKYQTIHNPCFIETMNIEHYMCSKCYAFDRERLYALYLQKHLAQKGHALKLLDIAPSNSLRRLLKGSPQIIYRSMDLMMEDVDDKLDITDMGAYTNEQFDFFICSHILEHIPDDTKAISELYRILKKGGSGIIMVPINLQLEKTVEDPYCTDLATRWKYYFQNDHIRMYAKNDFINRLELAGFNVEQLSTAYFGEDVFKKYAIFPTSVLYVVNKTESILWQ